MCFRTNFQNVKMASSCLILGLCLLVLVVKKLVFLVKNSFWLENHPYTITETVFLFLMHGNKFREFFISKCNTSKYALILL